LSNSYARVLEQQKVNLAIFTMSDFVEQRSCIKFCLWNEISAAETLRMQKAFDDQAMSQKNVYKWYKQFKEGRESVENENRSGRPSTSTEQHVNEIKDLVIKNRRLIIRDLADTINISFGSDHFERCFVPEKSEISFAKNIQFFGKTASH